MAKMIPLTLWASLNDIEQGSARRLARTGRLQFEGKNAAQKIAPRMWLVHPLAEVTPVARGGKRPGAGRKPKTTPNTRK